MGDLRRYRLSGPVTVIVTAHVEVTARDEDEARELALDMPTDEWVIEVAPSELSAEDEPPGEELDVEDLGPAEDES